VIFELTVFLLKKKKIGLIAVIFGEFYYNKPIHRHSVKETELKLLPTFHLIFCKIAQNIFVL